MEYCANCSNFHFLVTLSCGCSHSCLDCTLSSFRREIRQQVFRPCTTFKCGGSSQHQLAVAEALEIAAGSTEESEVLEELSRVTIGKMMDSVICPRRECGRIGWVDTSKSCSDPVECGCCGHQWVLPQLNSIWFRLFPTPLLSLMNDSERSDLVSTPLLRENQYRYIPHGRPVRCTDQFKHWLKYYWNQQCPSCGVFNPKQLTSPNFVRCSQCHIQYCWVCQKPLSAHSRLCTDSSRAWRVPIAVLIAAWLLKVATALLSAAEIWTTLVTVLWFFGLGVCGLLTITLSGSCLLLMAVWVCDGNPELFAWAIMIMGIGDIGFVLVGIATGWWSAWFGVLAALAFAGCQYYTFTRIIPEIIYLD